MAMEEALLNPPCGVNGLQASKWSKRVTYDRGGGDELEELCLNLNKDDIELARTLMMLAGKVTEKKGDFEVKAVLTKSTDLEGGRGCHKCKVCGKVFDSYQALGGHKASHRKSVASGETAAVVKIEKAESSSGRVHECKICHKKFSSGQALGGHKRLHYEGVLGKHANRTHLLCPELSMNILSLPEFCGSSGSVAVEEEV